MVKSILFALFRPFQASEKEFDAFSARINSTSMGKNNDEYVFEQLSALESKSGVLLTHISMMIAVTGLMLAVSQEISWFEYILAIELVAYLLLALLCIRCQYQFDNMDFLSIALPDPDNTNSSKKEVHKKQVWSEVIFRERIFRFSMRALFSLTIILSITVLVGTFLG